MGRQLKRVPLSFKWPVKEVWKGYINPYYRFIKDCPSCHGDGGSPEYRLLDQLWYAHLHDEAKKTLNTHPMPPALEDFAICVLSRRCLSKAFFNWAKYSGVDVTRFEPLRDKMFATESELMGEMRNVSEINYIHHNLIREFARVGWGDVLDQDDVVALVKDDRLWDFTRRSRNEEQRSIVEQKIKDGGNSWLPYDNGYVPTAEEINLWNRKGMGHDSLNSWVCIEDKLRRLGINNRKCPVCKGSGHKKLPRKKKKLFKNWKNYDPPVGQGFQLWENTSEGSPVSPVFETLENLCEWAEQNATTFASFKASKDEWMSMLDNDFVYAKEGQNIFL